jgi:SNF2 family DNA or RNA helicase
METIKKLLLPYQINDTNNLVKIITKNNAVLNSSDTGTGKTYTAIAACFILKLKPIVICPKSVISNWLKVSKIFNVQPFFVVNYESIKNLKYYDKNRNRKKCPFIKYDTDLKKYNWVKLPNDIIFIFDEAHKCSSLASYNARLLLGCKDTKKPIMILSATIADHPEKFRLFFYILNFLDPDTLSKDIDFKKYIRIVEAWIMRDPRPMLRIYNMLYPDRATAMRIDVLGDLFPETQINAIPYSMGNKRETEIQYQYEEINRELEALKDTVSKDKGNIMVTVLRAHQKIEMLKVPTFVELTNEFLEEGSSVVIFVNFTKTLKVLCEMLHTDCVIYGEQTAQEREINIENFQSNKERLIIANIKAGGVGLSLHDERGGHKRIALISPCWSALDLKQVLGRVHRAGGLTKSLQRIIYCANTVEEKIADKLQRKLKNLNEINNGDVDLTNITFDKKQIEI